MDIRLACLQGPHTHYPDGSPDPSADRAANLALLERTAAEAAAGGAHLLITSEMFTTGYNLGPATTAALAEPAGGPSAAGVARIAREHRISIVYGYPERAGDRVYNAVQLIDRAGRRSANYRKTHLFGDTDRGAFAAGGDLVVQAEVGGVVVGLLICYDIEFPETAWAHALAGTRLLLVPTANMRPFEYVSHQIVPTRAIESQLFIAYVNRVGVEREFEYCGESRVMAPDGRRLAAAGSGPALIFADVAEKTLTAAHEQNTYLADRRTDLYDNGNGNPPRLAG
ncbi:MAG TPA: carbon-nitrogen hydrolase family protein [Actinocrinis sp.]|nr:carbon-nitrogen hydrolase family protein [Actinocrinis sp.]